MPSAAPEPADAPNGLAVPLVLIGGSAGAVGALVDLVRAAPPALDAALLVVVHTPPDATSRLPEILARHAPFPVVRAKDGAPILPATVSVAPPDRHLLVEDGRLRVTRDARENRHRPAVDPLFRTAASSGPRPLVGVILSGALDDGTAGARAIRDASGVVVVQHPDDAVISAMPSSVMAALAVDHALPARAIGERLATLVDEARARLGEPRRGAVSDLRETEMTEAHGVGGERPAGTPSGYGCPECGGALWETDEAGVPRFRCRTGHAYTSRSLLAAQDQALEEALWSALRALEEQADLNRRLAERSRGIGAPRTHERFLNRAERAAERAAVVRRFLVADGPGDGPLGADETEEAGAAAGA